MKTATELKQLTVKELSTLAREHGVIGWHEMRKDELVKVVAQKERNAAARKAREVQKKTASPAKNKTEITAKTPKTAPPKKKAESKSEKPSSCKTAEMERNIARLKEKLGKTAANGTIQEDQMILMVRDPFWLHLYWKLSTKGLERAKAAMGHFWHTATQVIRLYRLVADGMSNPRREFVRDIRIHNSVSHWYIDVYDPPSSFQVELGYLSREGAFYPVASSNIVETPQNQLTDNAEQLDGNWLEVAEDFDRVYKLSGGLDTHNKEMKTVFEEQLKRPMSIPLLSRFGPRTHGNEKTRRNFSFQLDADLVIHGKTDPSVQISIRDEPIRLSPDGAFSVRFALSEKRQLFPINAASSDGVETQTVILSIDRNTKVLETKFLEGEED